MVYIFIVSRQHCTERHSNAALLYKEKEYESQMDAFFSVRLADT